MKLAAIASLIATAFPVALHAQPNADADATSQTVATDVQQARQLEGSPTDGAPVKQDLPTTKEVTSRQAMSQSQEGYTDVAKRQAGVTPQTSEGNGAPMFAIRGIKLNPQSNFRLDGGVAITAVQSMPTEDKERLETLKGANALMFGIASPAGIINMIPKRAGERDVTSLAITGNSFGQVSGQVDLGRRFGDDKQVGVRVNLSDTRIKSGVRDLSGNGKFGSVGWDWHATSRLTLQGDYEYYTRDASEQGSIALAPAVNGVVPLTRVPDPRNNLLGPGGDWARYVPVSRNMQLRADYLLGDHWRLLLQAGKSDTTRARSGIRLFNYDLATGAGATIEDTVTTNANLNKFMRAELIGDFDVAGIGNQLTTGVSSASRASESANLRFNLTQKQNIFDPVAIPAPTLKALTPNRSQDSKDEAIYAYDNIALFAKFKLLAGVRITKNTDSVAGSPDEVTYTKSPALGFVYELRPTTTVYASVMSGLEAGMVAPGTAANSNFVLAPTVSRQKEIGVRDSSWSGLMLNLAYFDITRANPIIDPITKIFGYHGNLSYKGVEASGSYRATPLWSLNTSMQYLDAIQLIDGKRPENTPKWSGNFGVAYRAPWLPGLTLRAGANTIARRAINPQNQGYIPGYTLFSAGASYNTVVFGKHATLQAGIENLGDKRYWNSVGNGQYGIGMSRSVRFGAKFDF